MYFFVHSVLFCTQCTLLYTVYFFWTKIKCYFFTLIHLPSLSLPPPPPLFTPPSPTPTDLLLATVISWQYYITHYIDYIVLFWLPLSLVRFEPMTLGCEEAALTNGPLRRSHSHTINLFYLCQLVSICY